MLGGLNLHLGSEGFSSRTVRLGAYGIMPLLDKKGHLSGFFRSLFRYVPEVLRSHQKHLQTLLERIFRKLQKTPDLLYIPFRVLGNRKRRQSHLNLKSGCVFVLPLL